MGAAGSKLPTVTREVGKNLLRNNPVAAQNVIRQAEQTLESSKASSNGAVDHSNRSISSDPSNSAPVLDSKEDRIDMKKAERDWKSPLSSLKEFSRSLNDGDRPFTYRQSDSTEISPYAFDKDAAELQKHYTQESDSSHIAIQKIISSGPGLSSEEAEKLHAMDPQMIENVMIFDEGVQSAPERNEGTRSLELWKMLQANPELLNTPMAIAQSSTAMAALETLAMNHDLKQITGANAKENQQLLPASTVDTTTASLPEDETQENSSSTQQHGQVISLADLAENEEEQYALTTVPSTLHPGQTTSLATVEKVMAAVIPAGATLEDALLLDDTPKNVKEWGPRPPEATAYDQLMLNVPDDEFLIDRGTLFEMYARNRANPAYWTSEQLASYYGTSESILLWYFTHYVLIFLRFFT